MGVVLGQLEDRKSRAIYYKIKNLTPAELKYMVTKKEFLAIVHAINQCGHYIIGYQVFVHTDHSTNYFLMTKLVTNGRVTCWLLVLQEFEITILDNLGKDNVVADFLSRLTIGDECMPVEDHFLDEYIFSTSTHSPWYADIANYFVAIRFTQTYPQEKRK